MSDDSATPRNDLWTAFLGKARTPEQQADLEFIREHFSAVYQTWGVAMLEMVAKVEEHEEGLRGQYARSIGNQEMIIEHLQRQETRDGQILSALTGFQDGLTRLGEDVTGLKQAFEERITALEDRQAKTERRLGAVENVIGARPAQRKEEQEAYQRGQDELRANQDAMAESLMRIEATLNEALTVEEKRAIRRLLAQQAEDGER